jgi:hypothetical protein
VLGERAEHRVASTTFGPVALDGDDQLVSRAAACSPIASTTVRG